MAFIETRNTKPPPGVYRNLNTVVHNTPSDMISGPAFAYLAPNGTHTTNWHGYLQRLVDVSKQTDLQVRDMYNMDYRPRAGSDLIDTGTAFNDDLPDPAYDPAGPVAPYLGPYAGFHTEWPYLGAAPDIGAYEFGDTNYWIPGYKDLKAGMPIPPDGSRSAQVDLDLMWLAGRDALAVGGQDVYLGTDPGALVFQGNQNDNIFNPGPLLPGQTYYWRVDTVTASGTVPGDV